ncbi:MAG: choice-of-anchor B family protein [Bacteroidia bacterium]
MHKHSLISLSGLVFLIFFSLISFGQIPQNLSLSGHLSYPKPLNDIWGYTDSSGHEYALVGTFDGLSIVDLANPSDPQEIHFVPGENSIWRDMKTFQHYVYVSNETGRGTLIVDLSGLPQTISWKDTVLQGVNTIHNLWIADGFLYESGFNSTGGFRIFDLNPDPWNPVYVGQYNPRYVHDVYVRGNLAYSAEIYDGLLSIVDVSVKNAPQEISNTDWINSFTHNTWLNDSGTVCFTTDELNNAYIYAWDVSDPTDVRQLDRIRSSLSKGKAAPHNVHVLNDYLITSYYADGIHLVDASRPNNLVEIGYFDTSPRTGPGLVGCWGAYPFLPSGLILATDMEYGLYVLQPQYIRASHLEGLITEATTGIPLPGVEIEIVGPGILDYSTTSGNYAMGSTESGAFSVIYAKPGYAREIRTVILTNGQLTVQNVQMTPAAPVTLSITILEEGTNSPLADADIEITSPSDTFIYKTDNNGQVQIANFTSGGYKIIAGKWGYQSADLRADINPGSPSLTFYLARGYYDDFTFDFHWSAFATAQKGNWVRDIPKATFNLGHIYNPDDDSPHDLGRKAYITGNQGGNALNDDVQNGTTILLSPNMDFSSYIDPVIKFDWWMANHDISGLPGNDTLIAELILGGSLYEVARFSGYRSYWDTASIRIRDYGPLGPTNFIRFKIAETSPEHITEAGIDFFRVMETATTGLTDEYKPVHLKLYPVPVSDWLSITCDLPSSESRDLHFSIWNVQGKKLADFPLYPHQNHWAVPFDLPSGIYLGTLESEGRRMAAQKIVKY